jgi:5-methylthioadenosine/S-adenosylhomocysteine deaminase
MDLLITDAPVLTCHDSRTAIERGAAAVRGNRIEAVGKSEVLEQQYSHLERLAGRGPAVLPGFINAHTHTALTVLRGTVEDWDRNAVYGYMSPVSYEMSHEERTVMVQLGCLAAIRSGCATLVGPFRHLPSYVPAMAATGLRLWASENCADINTLKIRAGDYAVDRDFDQVFLDRTIRGIEEYHGTYNDRLRRQAAAHAPDNCSPWMLDQLMQLSQRHGLTRTVHLAQSTAPALPS